MSVFDVNYNSDGLPNSSIAVRLRKAKMLAWLKTLVSPVAYLYGLFSTNRTNNLYWLNHSSQVCYIEAALNDVFDPVVRGIYISDGFYADPVYLYQRSEEKPVYLARRSEVGTTAYQSPSWLYTRAETYAVGFQFIVNVPHSVSVAVGYDVNRLRAIVDKYRLVSKNTYQVKVLP